MPPWPAVVHESAEKLFGEVCPGIDQRQAALAFQTAPKSRSKPYIGS